jgi:hypothetical protein
LKAREGEVQATLTECLVGLELSKKTGASVERCRIYQSPQSKTLSRLRIAKNFYQVGRWYSDLKNGLGSEIRLFPLLSSQPPQLFSSTGRAPYPVSLFREFQEMTITACKNSQNRMRNFTLGSEAGQSNLFHFMSTRCPPDFQARLDF